MHQQAPHRWFCVSAAIHLCTGLGVFAEINFGGMMGAPSWVSLSIAISFASLGAGLLSGRGGLPFVFGGMLAWWLIAPVAVTMGLVPAVTEMRGVLAGAAYDDWVTWEVLYGQMLRPLGIGVLIGGALSGVVASFPALKSAIKSLSNASKT